MQEAAEPFGRVSFMSFPTQPHLISAFTNQLPCTQGYPGPEDNRAGSPDCKVGARYWPRGNWEEKPPTCSMHPSVHIAHCITTLSAKYCCCSFCSTDQQSSTAIARTMEHTACKPSYRTCPGTYCCQFSTHTANGQHARPRIEEVHSRLSCKQDPPRWTPICWSSWACQWRWPHQCRCVRKPVDALANSSASHGSLEGWFKTEIQGNPCAPHKNIGHTHTHTRAGLGAAGCVDFARPRIETSFGRALPEPTLECHRSSTKA